MFIRRGDAWNITGSVEDLANLRLLLIAGSRDRTVPMALHHKPLVNALKESEANGLTEFVLDADHVLSDKRITLTRAVIGSVNADEPSDHHRTSSRPRASRPRF